MTMRPIADATRTVLRDALTEASRAGSATIDAEHVLLALTAHPDVAGLLDEHGLDREGIEEALALEAKRALAAVGVDVADYPAARPAAPSRRGPRFGQSAKRAVTVAAVTAEARGHRRIGAGYLLVGVLDADLGTVPRALDAAGIDRDELRARARRLL